MLRRQRASALLRGEAVVAARFLSGLVARADIPKRLPRCSA
jgi:hypothetical protein